MTKQEILNYLQGEYADAEDGKEYWTARAELDSQKVSYYDGMAFGLSLAMNILKYAIKED